MNYQLIQTDPLKIIYKSLGGLPSKLARDTAPPTTPEGYAYVVDTPFPTDPAPEGEEYIRLLTTSEYGWTTQVIVEQPIDFVTRIQMRDALIDAGLSDSIEAIIAGMPETTDQETIDKKKMAEWWNHAPNFRRDNARISTMQAALGLTDTEVDDLFLAASLVE